MQVDAQGIDVAAMVDIDLSREEFCHMLRRLGRGAQEYRRRLAALWDESPSRSTSGGGQVDHQVEPRKPAEGYCRVQFKNMVEYLCGKCPHEQGSRLAKQWNNTNDKQVSRWMASGALRFTPLKRGFYELCVSDLERLRRPYSGHQSDGNQNV
jgi:hypothetical protein